MSKRLCSLLLMLALLLCAAAGLAEQTSTLTAVQISALQKLVGDAGTPLGESAQPTRDMTAFQAWQWTDRLLAGQVRSLLGTIQSDVLLDTSNSLVPGTESVQWKLLELENTLSHFESKLEEDRLAILNGIELYQSGNGSEAERQKAVSRTLEAESEIKQIIGIICEEYKAYLTQVNVCRTELDKLNAKTVLNGRLEDLTAEADAIASSENLSGADFSITVVSKHQFRIQVMDSNKKPISGAVVTVTNQLNTTKTQTLTTDSTGKAVFSVSDMGADETRQMQLTLCITADGFRTREVKKVKLYGGESTTLYLEKDNGEPYLIMGGFNGCDILSERNTFYYSPENDLDHVFSAKLSCATDGTLELHYLSGTTEKTVSKAFKASDSNKTEFVFQDEWLSMLQPGGSVFFKIITKDEQEYTFETQLDIQRVVVDEPFLRDSSTLFSLFGGDGGFGFDIPATVPFIGGERLTVSIPGKAQKLMILPSGRAMFSWGAGFSSKDTSWKREDTQDIESAKKEFEERSTADKLLAKAGAYRDVNIAAEPLMLGSFSANVNPFVSLQGEFNKTEHLLTMDGSVGATLASKAAFSQTFRMGPAPFFAGVGFSTGASFGVDADVQVKMELFDGVLSAMEAPTIKYTGTDDSELSIPIRLELGNTIGMGLQDVATVALRGYGYLNPVVDLATKGVSASAKYGMGMGVTVRELFLRWQHTLIHAEGDLSTSNSAMTPSAPSDGEYQHFDSTGADMPWLSTSGVTKGSSGVEPTEKKQLFSQIDSATGDFQYAVIGDQTYLFWIQPGDTTGWNKVGARLMWCNLNDTTIQGEVGCLDKNSIPNANNGENGTTPKRPTYADYDFAVEVSRGVNNQGSSFCALTILSGMFNTGTGSGTSPDAPDESVLTTVLMKQKADNKGLDIVFYQEHTREFHKDDYAIMPEVFLTASGSDTESVYIISTCSSSDGWGEIYGQVFYKDENGLDGYAQIEPTSYSDGDSIARYHLGIPDATKSRPGEKINLYSLNRNDDTGFNELSRISYNHRELLATGDIVNFRVYSQLDTGYAKDRLFYLERVELDEGKYAHRLKSVTLDLANTISVVSKTDYDVEINADQFDIVEFGTGVYLYWTECSTPYPANVQTQAKYMVRCLRYDPVTDKVCGSFNMVELKESPNTIIKESPNTIKLMDSGTGFYTVDLQNDKGSYVRQSLYQFKYDLVSAAELTAATLTDNSVCAGDYVEVVFSVKNTGNIPLSGFDVEIKNGGTRIQTLHADCVNPDNNSSTIGAKVMRGAYTVTRISGMYDALNNDSWEITRTGANGTTKVQSVQTAMLMPGDTHYYKAKLLVPIDWAGAESLTVEISNVQGNIAANETNDPIVRLNTNPQTLNTDVHDLALSARIFKLNGEDYVRVNIKNLSGNTESSVKPVLTSVYNGTTLFKHQFVNSMGDDFGYSMDIPLRELTKGSSQKYLDLYVGADRDYDEYADSDNHVRLPLITLLCIIEQPMSIPAAAGQEAAFSVVVSGGKTPYSYQWQRMVGPNRWENIPGAKKDTYRIKSVKEDQNGLIVRCVVTDQYGDYVTSDPATLSILPQTGDRSQLALWLLLAAASAAVLALVYRKTRRR